ncbi:MAG: hypothetical protein RL094_606 [Candidatus Parcubacteria bacterium]|jgi:ubiquinone/menaquinone biosynthesis C-methylase UbiE
MFSDPLKNIAHMYIGEGMHVADFGAGIGHYTLAIAKKVGEYGKVFAIDVQADHLSALKNDAKRKKVHNIELIHSDLEQPNGSCLPDALIDRVVIVNMLFQNEHPEQIAKEAKRILKSKGRVVVIEWIDSYNHIGPHPDHVLQRERAQQIFMQQGFELEKGFDAGSHHYGLLFKNK